MVKQQSGSSVQSVERAFLLLETMADEGGAIGISALATRSGLPLPTIHRIVRTLVGLGYVHQDPDRRYVLGPRLIRLGEQATRVIAVFAHPHLRQLVDELGETANLAMLDDGEVVYVAQVPSAHSMRMFTEVGKRVLPHVTAVGKAMMATLPWEESASILKHNGMPARTDTSITDLSVFHDHLEGVRGCGYALDEGEQEVGVRCVAVAVDGAPTPLAFSVSGPAGRMSEDLVERAVPVLQAAARAFADDLR